MCLSVTCFLPANYFPSHNLIFSIFKIWKTEICPIYLIGYCEDKLLKNQIMWVTKYKSKMLHVNKDTLDFPGLCISETQHSSDISKQLENHFLFIYWQAENMLLWKCKNKKQARESLCLSLALESEILREYFIVQRQTYGKMGHRSSELP